MKNFLLILAFGFTTISFAQDANAPREDVPFAVIDRVPIYLGCTGTDNEVLKKCMSENISAFINQHFNMKKMEALNLPPKIYRTAVQFKIDKYGNVVDVQASADRPEIEAEAERVVSNLPKMIPGEHRGKRVGVLYSLPIIFKIEPPKRTRKN
ncbi:energy transducer TonB [Aequorivita sp. 609]|uniref:energy transducer TonB n=1 Tax=Aequorivita TaxID=153265 RepID=UPI00111FD98D|nr:MULTISPECIES: energy transducer TonB [Aequorivita]MBB6682610.1 energy transducer TonB [Aequorivita sp. 609]